MNRAFVSKDRPFPGLRPFEFEDNAFFFGREEQVSALYRLLDRNRFIAVVGSSGSGKSSLVKAGLLPLLQHETDEQGGRTWRRITLHPGDAPMAELEKALVEFAAHDVDEDESNRAIRRERIGFALRRSSFGLSNALDQILTLEDSSLLLVVDQFEEIFRYSGDDAVNFVQLLLEASRDRSHAINVLITMRSDFIGDCSRFYDLPEAVSAAQFLVPSLTRDQRDDVIRQPIEKAGKPEKDGGEPTATIDSTLVERLLNDIGGENDQLPVLQHCLARLWEKAKPGTPNEPRRLTQQHYDDVGRISGALSKHADEIMNSPELAGLGLAVEQLFRALSKVDEEGRAVRRTRLYRQLVDESGLPETDMRAVVNRFRRDDCSFIVPSTSALPELHDDTRLDIVHEALLRKWEKISAPLREELLGGTAAGWLYAEAEDGRFYRGLLAILERNPNATLSAAQYKDAYEMWTGHPDEWGNPRAPKTPAWADRYGPGGYERVRRLLENSRIKLEDDERTHQQAASAKRSGRIAIAASLIAVLALAMVIGAVILTRAADAARAQAIVATKEATKEKIRAEHAANAAKIAATNANDKEWLANHIRDKLKIANAQLAKAKASAVGNMDVAITNASLAQSETGKERRSRAGALAEAGRRALLDGQNDDAALYLGAAFVLNPVDRDVRVLLPQAIDKVSMRQRSLKADDAAITTLQFSPASGRSIIAAAGADGSVKLWEPSGHLLGAIQDYDPNDRITALAFDPAGRYLATVAEDGSGHIHDLRGGSIVGSGIALGNGASAHVGRINAVHFSHNGSNVVTAGGDGRIVIWRAATGAKVSTWPVDVYANDVLFTPQDRNVIAALADGSLRTWNWKTQQSSKLTTGMDAPLLHVAVDKDGTRAAAGGADGSLLLYDLVGHKPVTVRHDGPEEITTVSFDSTGRHVIVSSADGTVRILSAATGELTAILPVQSGAPKALSAVSSASGTEVATTYGNGLVALWTIDGHPIASFRSGRAAVSVASFSPNSALLATGSDDGRISIWQPRMPLVRGNATHNGPVESVAFDPTGALVLSGGRDGTAILWRSGNVLNKTALLHHSHDSQWMVGARFSHDGQRALTVGGDSVKVWNVTHGDPSLSLTIHPTIRGRRFTDAAFLPDGHGVLAVQTGADPLHLQPYKSNRWFVWSLSGKRILAEPASRWWSPPREAEITNDSRYALLFDASSAEADLFSLASGKTANSSSDVTAFALTHANHRYTLAIGAGNGTVSLMPAVGERLRRWPFTGQGHVSAMAFSADDRWLIFAHSDDLTTKVWDVSNGRLHAALRARQEWGNIRYIAASPGAGSFVLTLSADSSAELWDRDTGELIGLAQPPSGVTSAAFDANGSNIVLGCNDGSVYLWRLNTHLTPYSAAAYVLQSTDLSNPEANPLASQAIAILRQAGGHAAK